MTGIPGLSLLNDSAQTMGKHGGQRDQGLSEYGREAGPCSCRTKAPRVEMAAAPEISQPLLRALSPQSFVLPLLGVCSVSTLMRGSALPFRQCPAGLPSDPATEGWTLPPDGSISNTTAGGGPGPLNFRPTGYELSGFRDPSPGLIIRSRQSSGERPATVLL